MNVQLVNSLVEVVLNLSPEDQKLFHSRLHTKQLEKATYKQMTPTEKAEKFRQWLAQFPKSSVSLPAEASLRENIYGDRGV
ncbi:hypothetical protein NIES2107_63030 [Nostoc carneum NIES-2107]|nr:hypothetical protein NIES2107_63030 [Nostoc carneum NIES-2107]